MHQTADALSRLNASDKDKTHLEDDLPLYAIDNSTSTPISVHTITHEEDRARIVPITKPTDDKTECDPPTTLKIIQAQQPDTFCGAAATQLEQDICELTVNKESLLVCKAGLMAQSNSYYLRRFDNVC